MTSARHQISWVRVCWAGNDFWYPSIGARPMHTHPASPAKKIAPQFSEAIDLAEQSELHHKPPTFPMGEQIKHMVSISSFEMSIY